eukprot:580315-Lingulodinium_polyedra.AAC.1
MLERIAFNNTCNNFWNLTNPLPREAFILAIDEYSPKRNACYFSFRAKASISAANGATNVSKSQAMLLRFCIRRQARAMS